jgi:coenzyme F420-0:L-glutamate ligase / coenzyme F420-1:gamma-L-glutamate ligase
MNNPGKIEIIPICVAKDIEVGENIVEIISNYLKKNNECLRDNDVLVITHKIISKSEGRILDLTEVKPTAKAKKIATNHNKDPRLVELIMLESLSLLKLQKGVILAETKHGFVCANAGIDNSNVSLNHNKVTLLPIDSDRSARAISKEIRIREKKNVAVIISDTFGRPFREGQVNVAIGISGLEPVKSYVGNQDMYGKSLRVTEIAIADEIASAAELVMGKTSRIPIVIIRGLQYDFRKANILRLIRRKENDFFR